MKKWIFLLVFSFAIFAIFQVKTNQENLKKGDVMGTAGQDIVDLDINELIKELNRAYADEWLAYYQYVTGSLVIEGKMSSQIQSELKEHAEEELKHAYMLANRIIQLGGTPLLTPKEWYEKTSCGYEEPNDFRSEILLKQNIKGEKCAIKVYKKLVDMTKDKDPITHDILLKILQDEVEHEADLESLLSTYKAS